MLRFDGKYSADHPKDLMLRFDGKYSADHQNENLLSKMEKVNITIEFCKFELVQVPNFS